MNKVFSVVCGVGLALGALCAAGGVRVGAINWDCSVAGETAWFVGYQMRSLSPARYRYLTPYYAVAKDTDAIVYPKRTQADYDRELQYAIDAGIDYMAYCWYGEEPLVRRMPVTPGQGSTCEEHLWELTAARQLHARSALRNKIGLCAIILGNHAYTDGEIANLAATMREGCYEKVLEGRPLLYVFGDGTGGEILARIRRAARTAGVADPYVVAMHGTRKNLPTTGDRSVQARSAYAPPEPPKQGAFHRFPELYRALERQNAAWLADGFDIVPAFATGRDHDPRIERQVPWTRNPPLRFAAPATERELVDAAYAFKAFMTAHREKCPLDHVLTYAWNEFEEGAYICPLWAPNGRADTSRLKAFAKVSRIFKGEQGVTAAPDDPLPDLADVRKRLPEVFAGARDACRYEWFVKRLEAAERLAALPERTRLMQAELDEFRLSFKEAFAHWANDPLNPASQAEVLDVADFGAVGDGRTDSIPAFDRVRKAVQARNGKPTVIRVPAGDYLFGGADGAYAKRGCNVDFSRVTNCVLRGESPEKTRFVFGLYEASGIACAKSVNSAVMNISCRYAERPFAQAVVESYDATTCSAIVRAHPAALRPDDPRYRKADHSQVCCVFNADGTKKVPEGPLLFFDLRADDLGNGRYRVYFDAKRPSMKKMKLEAGQYVVLPDRSNRHQGLCGEGAAYMTFSRLYFHNARSGALNCGRMRYAAATHCRTCPEGEGIIFSSNADTFYNGRGSFLAHSEFHHMCDDGANSLGYGKEIFAQEGSRALIIREISGRLQAGDLVQVMDVLRGRFRATLRVSRREDFTLPNGAPRIRLTFDEDLPTGIVTTASIGVMSAKDRYAISHGLGTVKRAADLLYAPLQYGTGFVCWDNYIHDLRGCGINVQCPHSIVEGNVIENVQLAFKMTGLTQWFEGTPPSDVVVRGNVFRNCELGVQTFFCNVNGRPAEEKAIRFITFVSNRFERVERPWALHSISDSTLDGRAIGANPVRGDGLIPFLAITGKPTEADVCAKVADMQAAGAESFLIYARSGLEYEYMGEDWLKMMTQFCAEAERRSMKVWLYDEYNWPSGTCKGRVPQENDQWRYRELGVFPDGKGGFVWHEQCAPVGWVNVCEPAAIERFMDLTHRVYEKRLARWFKNGTILGIFTDEPGHPTKVTFPQGKPLIAFRNYAGLEDDYKASVGRDLRADVERYLRDKTADDVWPAYAACVGRRFRRAYFDKLCAWCDKMGIVLTGHLISEGDPAHSVEANGLPMHCLRGETLPGMDEIHTAYDAAGKLSRPIEWVTYNLARQAIVFRGNQGGLAELFACGPADLMPSVLRQVIWLAAFHGVDHYATSMDVMDEKGLVEKHGYLAPAGSIHPWYAARARLLVDEAREAAVWARKRVAAGEVAVRYPNRLAALAAYAKRTRPALNALLGELERHQLTCRLVEPDEKTDLPLVFGCADDGTYYEERTGRRGLTCEGVRAVCERNRRRLARTFVITEADGTPAEDVLVREYADGSCAAMSLRPTEDRLLVAEHDGSKHAFRLPAFGIKTFAAGMLPPSEETAMVRGTSLADVEWHVQLDRPNLYRVNFDTNRLGSVTCAEPIAAVTPVLRECALSYAVTSSGRPIGANERAPAGEKVICHTAEPYSFALDGHPCMPVAPCASLPPAFATLYRAGTPRTWPAGKHPVRIVTGEADQNYFLPAMLLSGDFEVRANRLFARSNRTVKFGSLAAAGFPHYIGRATWKARVTAPRKDNLILQLDTAMRVTDVRFCGVPLGAKAWAPFAWKIPSALQGRTGELEITLWTSVQPMFGDVDAGTWNTHFWFDVLAPNAPAGLYDARWH